MRYRVFISYRREGASELGQLLYTRLLQDGYEPFFDVEDLRSGKFNEQLYNRIEECESVLLLLPPNALDRRDTGEDWVRMEIAHALKCNKNIIPVLMRGFQWPDILPEDIANVRYCHGVTANMEYFDAVYSKLKNLLKITPEANDKEVHTNKWLHNAQLLLDAGDFEKAQAQYEKILKTDPECVSAYLGIIMAEHKLRNKDELREFYSQNIIYDNGYFKLAREYADGDEKAYLESLIPPICVTDKERASNRCDGCGDFVCDTCGFPVKTGWEGGSIWVEGKLLCPYCMKKLHKHCKDMRLNNILVIAMCILGWIGIIAVCILIANQVKPEISFLIPSLVIGLICGLRYSFREDVSEDNSLLMPIIYIAVCVVGSPIMAVWYLGKRIYYIARMNTLIGISAGADSPSQKLSAYLGIVSITRKLGMTEPDWN